MGNRFVRITQIFIVATIVLIAGFDFWVIIMGGTEATISHELITISYQYPMVPFCMGILCGHLFWRMPSTPKTLKIEERNKE